MSVNIYNPREFPFGPLSNNYIHPNPLVIDEKRWNTVTNYIYSNLLITPINRLKIQTAPILGSDKKTKLTAKLKQVIANTELRQKRPMSQEEIVALKKQIESEVAVEHMNIYSLYNYLMLSEKTQLLRTAVEKAYNAKVSQHPEVSELLLKTGNRPIIYKSDNVSLGFGPDGEGLNLIGKILEQIRHNVRIQSKLLETDKEKASLENNIIRAYKAYYILEKMVSQGDNLASYVGKTAKQIVQSYSDKKKLDQYFSITKPKILKTHYRDLSLPETNQGSKVAHIISTEVKQPGYIVQAVRNLLIKTIRTKVEEKRNSVIVKTYIDYMIAKKYKNLSPQEIKQAGSQLTISVEGISPEQFESLSNRIITLFNRDLLPEKLTDLIKEALEGLDIPDEDEKELQVIEKLRSSSGHSSSGSSGSASSSTSSSDSASSTSDEEDVYGIKKMLGSDSKARKHFLITNIQKYTGKSYEKYKDLDIQDLENLLKNYETVKVPMGYWEIKTDDNVVIKKVEGNKPSRKSLKQIIKKYNKKHKTSFSTAQVILHWVSDVKVGKTKDEEDGDEDSEEETKNEDEEEDIKREYEYEKEAGQELIIRPTPKETGTQFAELSPTFERVFSVDNLTFPSVSIYITTMLLTHTGKTFDIKNKSSFVRGISVQEARSLISEQKGDDTVFKSIDETNRIYNEKYKETIEELLKTFATIALKKKFEDPNLQNLLLLTGKKEIIWNDPHDSILGVPNNFVGETLVNIRKGLQGKEKYIQYGKKKIHGYLNTGTVSNFILSDQLVSDWVERKVLDMCNTVYKMKQFLSINKIDEKIDTRFMNIVLNTIYQPNPAIVEEAKNKIGYIEEDTDQKQKIMKKLTSILSECGGVPTLSKQYKSRIVDGFVEIGEIDRLKNEVQERRDMFYGIRQPSKKLEHVDKSMKKMRILMAKETESFMKKSRSSGEIERFWNKQEKKLEEYIKKLDFEGEEKELKLQTLDHRQRKEWMEFMADLNKTVKSGEDIEAKSKEYKKKQKEALKEIEKKLKNAKLPEEIAKIEKERDDFEESMNTDMQDYITLQFIPKKTLQERNKKMEAFIKKLNQEYVEYMGIDTSKKSPDEITQFEQELKGLVESIADLERDYKTEVQHKALVLQDMAEYYWNRIIAILAVLLKPVEDPTEQDLRKVIVKSLEISEEPCMPIHINYDDNTRNCIALALVNILAGLEGFKHQYAEDIEMGQVDLDIATSIILDLDIKEKKEKETDIQEEQAIVQKLEGDDDALDPENFQDDMGIEEELDEIEYDYDDERGGDEDGAVFEFGGKKKKNKVKYQKNSLLEQVKLSLKEICKKELSGNRLEECAEQFIRQVEHIYNYKMPEKTKLERISFFASP